MVIKKYSYFKRFAYVEHANGVFNRNLIIAFSIPKTHIDIYCEILCPETGLISYKFAANYNLLTDTLEQHVF